MTACELIDKLAKVVSKYGDLEVTTSYNGTYLSLENVGYQKWANDYASATLYLGKYDREKCLINKTVSIEEDSPSGDEKFLDNVNENLSYREKIDKKEALEAKKIFDKDCTPTQRQCQEWFNKNYGKIEKDIMRDLFGSDKPLDHRSTGDLKYHLFKNGWSGEIDNESLDNRGEILNILYTKLNEDVKKKIRKNATAIYYDILNQNVSGEE